MTNDNPYAPPSTSYTYLWTLPLVVLEAFIPGTTDAHIIHLVVIIDVLLIFDRDRRCMHDYIAGSQVVYFRADRGRKAFTLWQHPKDRSKNNGPIWMRWKLQNTFFIARPRQTFPERS